MVGVVVLMGVVVCRRSQFVCGRDCSVVGDVKLFVGGAVYGRG